MIRRLRFKLRTLLVLMLLTSVVMGAFALRLRSADRQQAAAKRVAAQGGVVLYDYQIDRYGTGGTGKSKLPGWLLGMLGVDFFHAVRGVDFSQASLGEPIDLSTVKPFADLRAVTLAPSCDDQALATLPTMPELRLIFAVNTKITDAGLDALLRQPMLRYPIVGWSGVTGEGLRRLASAPNLRWLAVDATQLDERGVAALAEAPSIEWLWIDGEGPMAAPLDHLGGVKWLTLQGVTEVRFAEGVDLGAIESLLLRGLTAEDLDRVCALLPRMPKLRRVTINESTRFEVRTDIVRGGLSASHVEAICKIKRLKDLRLYEEPVAGAPTLTDEDLRGIERLKRLEYLRLTGPDITNAARDRIREALPDCSF